LAKPQSRCEAAIRLCRRDPQPLPPKKRTEAGSTTYGCSWPPGPFASPAIHALVVPERVTRWPAPGMFFIAATAAELVLAVLLFTRPQPALLLAAAVASIGPLALRWYSPKLSELGIEHVVVTSRGGPCTHHGVDALCAPAPQVGRPKWRSLVTPGQLARRRNRRLAFS
jgi:hypothetical protein